jgi:hypothetical protein
MATMKKVAICSSDLWEATLYAKLATLMRIVAQAWQFSFLSLSKL